MPARAAAALSLWLLASVLAAAEAQPLRFDRVGFDNMLQLRAEMEGGRAPEAPGRYVDLSYYERALARLSK